MGSVPRYKGSVLNRRPYHSHRYDVYAPKLQRQVTLFGRDVLDLWTSLEGSAQVLTYCERPLLIPDVRPQRAFDFWVQRPDGDELLILLREGDSDTTNDDAGVSVRALDAKSIDGIPIRYVDPNNMAQHRTALTNWGTIIRDLAAFQRFVPEPLCRALLSTLGSGKTIGQLQSELTDFDSSTVRLAIYMVLHRGHATCKQLVTVPLGPDHVIERP